MKNTNNGPSREQLTKRFSGIIWCILGKSASGKDTIYRALLANHQANLEPLIMTTTRPRRANETNGKEYFFVTREKLDMLDTQGKVIERRDYQTDYGTWSYAIIDDGQINGSKDYLLIETPEGYKTLQKKLGDDHVKAIYIHVGDGERLQRALAREREQSTPRYDEMCRRFLADEKDFKQIDEQSIEYDEIERENIKNAIPKFDNEPTSNGEQPICCKAIMMYIAENK